MGQALYRKHRPKSLRDVVGQEHVTDTLSQALETGRISHAYLFSGPRGVGKTSIARILAHQINQLDYDDDSAHIDIIEIDAASNNSVEDVRDLREKVYVAPAAAKYKIYIIDEVHMLSKAAFNALLKTLEEPPAHVVFILATTETHKLPDTIISRTQHYAFKPVDQDKVVAHLRHIAEQESISIDDAALTLLAAHGEGSFRDSISLLDQARSIAASSAETILGADDIRRLLGIAPDEAITGLITCLHGSGQVPQLLQQLSALYGQGLQAAAIASQIAAALRTAVAGNTSPLPAGQTVQLMKNLIDVPASRSPERLLEIVLLESADLSGIATPAATVPTAAVVVATTVPNPVVTPAQPAVAPKPATITSAPVETPAPTTQAPAPAPLQPQQPPQAAATYAAAHHAKPTPPAAAEAPKAAITGPAVAIALDSTVWPQIINDIKKEYNTLYGVLRMAQPVFTAEGLELQFKFLFHQKRLNEVKNKQIIADFIKKITGNDVVITCTFSKGAQAPVIPAGAAGVAPTATSPDIAAISDIFGGGEVM